MKKPEIISFGCRLNSFESEVIRQHAEAAGLDDIVIINSCTVTAEAGRQARQAIRKARRLNPGSRIIVTGCAVQVDPETFARMDEVDAVLGNQEKLEAKSFENFAKGNLPRVQVKDIMQATVTTGHMINGFEGRARAFIEVQTGCDHRCTFCIIPFGRGNSRSVPIDRVVSQARRLVQNGYKEIVLTGVDLTSYGHDLASRPGLGTLVKCIINEVPDLPRLRISSIDPAEIDEVLFGVMTEEPRVMPHFHLSLQSGDNLILKRMKRRHSRDDAIQLCNKIRRARPEAVFGADFIAGFPTETEDMFQNTLKLVDECGLSFLHVFPFSPRQGTPAAKMPQLTNAVKKERAKRLRKTGDAAARATFKQTVGTSVSVLVERNSNEGASFGHTEQFVPVRMTATGQPGRIERVLITAVGTAMVEGNVLHG